jgi:GMP synthase (glutamine-hydrolysing)
LNVEKPSGVIAVLEHSSTDVAGEIGRHAIDHGFELASYRVDLEDTQLPELGAFEMLLVMGSYESVNNSSVAWIERERTFVTEVVEAGTPVLGVCFGAQLLAQALGGSVERLGEPEVGWKLVEVSDETLVVPGPWMVWHEDHVRVPDGAEVLARSDVCVQAFSAGPHLGVQFHPEVSPELLRAWTSHQRTSETADPAAVQRLHAGIAEHAEASTTNAAGLLDRFLDRAGLRGQR